LYTPQRLFGEVGSSSDILSHEPFLERARLQREQEQDGSARLALGAYVVARLVDKLLTMKSDDGDLDGFRWQLEAVRRHVDELPSDAPENAHLSGIVAAIPAERGPTPSLWKGLTAYAYFLEHEGRLEESLEMLTLAARAQGTHTSAKDYAAYALFAGRLNRQLARWDLATRCYGAAEEAGLKAQDLVCALRGRLGRGAVHRGVGNLPAAREVAEAVVRDAAEFQLPDVQALAYADLGAVYSLQGLRLEELEANYNAFSLTSDSLQRMRILGDIGSGLHRIGAYEASRLAFQIVINSNAKALVRANALLELMELESTLGNRVAFERCRAAMNETRDRLSDRLSPSMATDYQYKSGTGLARFGQIARAREALTKGLALAEANRLNVWYFKIEQALEQLSESQSQELQHQAEPSHPAVVGKVMVGLQEYAATAGV
jgi:tetratricopeptide (TPR) repeat protein